MYRLALHTTYLLFHMTVFGAIMEGGAYKREVPNVGFINIAFLVYTTWSFNKTLAIKSKRCCLQFVNSF